MWRRALIVQAALIGAVLLVLLWRARPDGSLHVFLLATKGDAALIQTPAGRYVLIDGGSDPTTLAAALGQRLPFWRRSLAAVVLTRTDAAHVPGQVAALTRYRAGLALAPSVPRASAALAEWQRQLRATNTPIRTARVGETLNFDGATLRVLAAGDGDEASLILRLDYGPTSVVFDQSGTETAEATLVDAGALPPASLVVYPWQRDAHTAFMDALRPQTIVFSDGYQADAPIEQTFGERVVGSAKLYHEDIHGVVEWISDGRQARVVAEK